MFHKYDNRWKYLFQFLVKVASAVGFVLIFEIVLFVILFCL